jgi:hypothetical protein
MELPEPPSLSLDDDETEDRTMKAALTTLMTLTAALMLSNPADAVTANGYTMEILVDGVPLQEYAARGTTYVEADEGAEYAIRLRNNTGRRIAIALAVDGLNSIDARTTSARKGRKWVLAPWQTVTIEGWQTSGDTARRFFFTTEDASYGAWLGRTTNLGAIEAVVFREKRPHPITQLWSGRDKSAPAAPQREGESRRAPSSAGELDEDAAATGIGDEIDHRVRLVDFRAESSPAASLRVRYEYRPQLVRLGVLPWPGATLDRREQARGFTDSQWAPDPYSR